MDDVHVHLLVNHVPVLGTVCTLLMGIHALARRQPDVLRVALGVLVIGGVGSFAATQTGERAEELVEDLPDVSGALGREHEEVGEIRHPEIRGDGFSPALGDGAHDDPSDDDRYDD